MLGKKLIRNKRKIRKWRFSNKIYGWSLCSSYFSSGGVVQIVLVCLCVCCTENWVSFHYSDVIMSPMASQITSLTIVYSTVYSGADQRKQQSSASLAFVRGIHRWPVNSPHKWPATRKMYPFDDGIMFCENSATVYFFSNFEILVYPKHCIQFAAFHSYNARLCTVKKRAFIIWQWSVNSLRPIDAYMRQ